MHQHWFQTLAPPVCAFYHSCQPLYIYYYRVILTCCSLCDLFFAKGPHPSAMWPLTHSAGVRRVHFTLESLVLLMITIQRAFQEQWLWKTFLAKARSHPEGETGVFRKWLFSFSQNHSHKGHRRLIFIFIYLFWLVAHWCAQKKMNHCEKVF